MMDDRDAPDGQSTAALAFFDEDGVELLLDPAGAASLLEVTADLDAATISACPTCRSRVLACLALIDLLDRSAPHPLADALGDLADDAPSSHCYVQDLATRCRHQRWLDPGRLEWAEVVGRLASPDRGPRR
ncbi:MAG: hypothetical protein ACKOA9_06205 [Actinomycetota bacterium]